MHKVKRKRKCQPVRNQHLTKGTLYLIKKEEEEEEEEEFI